MLIRAILWTGFGQVSTLAAGLVTAALVNRAISPEGRGIVAEAQTWAGLFIVLLGFSLTSAIYHFANQERYALGDNARLYIVLLTSACASFLATAAMGALLWGLSDIVSEQTVALWPLILCLPAASIFFANLQALGVALGRTRLAAATNVQVAALSLLLLVPAYFAEAIDIRFVLFTALAVQTIGALVMLIAIWRRVGCSAMGVTTGLLCAFVGSGMKQHIGTVSLFAYTRANQLIVFHYFGERETGLLAAAHALAFGCFALFSGVQTALYSTVLRNKGDGLDVTIVMLRVAFYCGLVLVVPAVLAADPILRAYGGINFADAASCFRLLIPAAWILSVCAMIAPYYVKAGAFWLASLNSLLMAVVSVLLSVLLVPMFAANGAAAATLFAIVLGFAGVLVVLKVVSGSWPWRALVPDFRKEIVELLRWLHLKREGGFGRR